MTTSNWKKVLDSNEVIYGGIPCPTGYYCPPGTPEPLACPDGLTVQGTGAMFLSQCQPCPAGRYCEAGNPTPIICPAGHYCVHASAKPTPCPPGSMSGMRGAEDMSACSPCPAGYICPSGSTNVSSADQVCPKGHFCPENSAEPVPCLPGRFNRELRASRIGQCFECISGFYCPERGTVHPNDHPCPGGFYCPSGSIAPHPCPAGSYCPSLSDGPKPCVGLPGYYCPHQANQPLLCPAGHVCPDGSSAPLPCPKGSFHPLVTSPSDAPPLTCKVCP
ncbi:gcc2 and gcc3 domain-containing protein, partial [Cystoisospora suis]